LQSYLVLDVQECKRMPRRACRSWDDRGDWDKM